MLKVFGFILIFLTICNRSNKFNQIEVLNFMKTVQPSQYLITKKFSKFKDDFSEPKIIRLRKKMNFDIFSQIRKAKFGVIVQYIDTDDEEEEEKFPTTTLDNEEVTEPDNTDDDDDYDFSL